MCKMSLLYITAIVPNRIYLLCISMVANEYLISWELKSCHKIQNSAHTTVCIKGSSLILFF